MKNKTNKILTTVISESKQNDEVLDENFYFHASEYAETELEDNTVIDTEKFNNTAEKYITTEIA